MRCVTVLSLVLRGVTALSAAQWRAQSIYQVLTDRFALPDGSTTAPCQLSTYCGGTWQGLINQLDYIQGMGFTAVWISPVVKQIDGPTTWGYPYHGYWMQDLNSLNAHFGTPADLKALSAALHSRGMYLMVDVVTNHMAYSGAPSEVDYTTLKPFNAQSYYHPYCQIDYTNTTSIQKCWTGDAIVSLPDLRTEDAGVRKVFADWASNFVTTYGVDGLRIDSAQQVQKEFYPSFISAAGVFALGEVYNGDPSYLCGYQSVTPGLSVLNYAAYFWIRRAFSTSSGSMTQLSNGIQMLSGACSDTTLLGNFIENHDNPRFASLTTDSSLIRNAIAYSVFSDGIPILYYGQEQGLTGMADPGNRQAMWSTAFDTNAALYKYIAKLNSVRKIAIAKDPSYLTSKTTVVYSDARTLVTSKGAASSRLISIFTNVGAAVNTSVTLNSSAIGVTASSRLVDLLSCSVVSVDSAGNLAVNISSGLPVVLYSSSQLSGKDLCANAAGPSPTTSSANSSSTNSKPSSISTSSLPQTSSPVPSSVASHSQTSSSKASSTPISTPIAPYSQPSPSKSSSVAASSPTPVSTSVACPASNSTIYASNGKNFLIECGIDHAGGDLKMVWVNGLKRCVDTCATTAGCVDVSLSGGACYMKSRVGKAIFNNVQGARLVNATIGSASTPSTTPAPTATSTPSSIKPSPTMPTAPATSTTPSSTKAPQTTTTTHASSTSSSKISPSMTTSKCSAATAVAVTFYHNATTSWGDGIRLVGSLPELANWNVGQGLRLSAEKYPIWNVTVTVGANVYFEYKFVNVHADSTVVWEHDPNRNYTAPISCATTAMVNSTWDKTTL